MGITFQNYFENRVNELLENTQELTLFIFRGFGIKQIKYLVHHRNSILNSDDIIADNIIQINVLNQKARALNRALMLAEHDQCRNCHIYIISI